MYFFSRTDLISVGTFFINPASFKIGRITVPESITKLVAPAVGDMIERRINQIGGADIKDASFKTGVFHLEGSVPETIKY